MIESTKDWLRYAKDDLDGAIVLIETEYLTNLVAFHCQQCIEKTFKAIMINNNIPVKFIHDIFVLYNDIKHLINFEIDIDTLLIIKSVYSETRYPIMQGMLPDGKPTTKEATQFIDFTKEIYNKTMILLSNE